MWALLILAPRLSAQTSGTSDPLGAAPSPPPERSSVVWATGVEGPTTYGGGAGIRWKYIGIGFNSFHVDRNSPVGAPPRPGGWAYSIDFYGYWDALAWLAAYGNLGLVGRSSTDAADQAIADDYAPRSASAYGLGAEFTLFHRLVLGGGYQAIIPSNDDGLNYSTITSIVVHLGYRF